MTMVAPQGNDATLTAEAVTVRCWRHRRQWWWRKQRWGLAAAAAGAEAWWWWWRLQE
jgi:hypothetical protein